MAWRLVWPRAAPTPGFGVWKRWPARRCPRSAPSEVIPTTVPRTATADRYVRHRDRHRAPVVAADVLDLGPALRAVQRQIMPVPGVSAWPPAATGAAIHHPTIVRREVGQVPAGRKIASCSQCSLVMVILAGLRLLVQTDAQGRGAAPGDLPGRPSTDRFRPSSGTTLPSRCLDSPANSMTRRSPPERDPVAWRRLQLVTPPACGRTSPACPWRIDPERRRWLRGRTLCGVDPDAAAADLVAVEDQAVAVAGGGNGVQVRRVGVGAVKRWSTAPHRPSSSYSTLNKGGSTIQQNALKIRRDEIQTRGQDRRSPSSATATRSARSAG